MGCLWTAASGLVLTLCASVASAQRSDTPPQRAEHDAAQLESAGDVPARVEFASSALADLQDALAHAGKELDAAHDADSEIATIARIERELERAAALRSELERVLVTAERARERGGREKRTDDGDRARAVLVQTSMLRAQLATQRGSADEAARCLDDTCDLALGGSDVGLAFKLAHGSFAEEKLTARLLRDPRMLVKPAACVSLLVARAERADEAGRYADEARDLEAALAWEPSDARFQERFTWYGRLGVALAAQGLFSRALSASQTALDLAIVLDDASYIVEVLNSISNHEYAVDRDDLALQALEHALACVETGGLEEGELHVSIGSSLVRRHERAAAREHLERARALAHAAGESHPREALEFEARVLLGLVEAYDERTEQSERETALAAAQDAIAKGETLPPRDQTEADVSFEDARTMFFAARAWNHLVAGRFAAAVDDARRALARLAHTEELLARLTAQGTLVRALIELDRIEEARTEYEIGISWFDDAHSRVELQHSAGLRGKNVEWQGVHEELVTRELLRAGSNAQLRDAILAAGLREAQIWKALTLHERTSPRVHVQAAPASARKSAHSFACDARRIQDALPDEGTCLIEYADGFERHYAYVFARTWFTRIELPTSAEPADRVERFLDAITGKGNSSTSVIAELGFPLYEEFVAPVIAEFTARSGAAPWRLVVAPTNVLARLPFDALLTRAVPLNERARPFADWPFVLHAYRVDYVPSLPMLVQFHERGPRALSGAKLAIVAAPNYTRDDPAPNPPDPRREEWQLLPRALDEARSLVRAFGADERSPARSAFDAFIASGKPPSGPVRGERISLYVHDAARKSALFELDSDHAWLFCIAHTDVQFEQPERSGLVLSFADGAYERFTSEDAERLPASLDLDLVVLSSCSTAVGPAQRGEGVLSFGYAWLQAGSRGVIASLWPVPDDPTFELFASDPPGGESFHRALAHGTTPAEALYEAKRAIAQRRIETVVASATRGGSAGQAPLERARRFDPADPYFWASFAYVGAAR